MENPSNLRDMWLFSLYGDGGYLDARIVDQRRHLYGRARGLGIRHHGLVNLVHVGELTNVSEKHGHGNDVLHVETSFLDDFLDVGQSSLSFGGDPAGRELAMIVRAFLSRYVEGVAGDHSVAEGETLGARELDGAPLLCECSGLGKQREDKQSDKNMLQRQTRFVLSHSGQLLFLT